MKQLGPPRQGGAFRRRLRSRPATSEPAHEWRLAAPPLAALPLPTLRPGRASPRRPSLAAPTAAAAVATAMRAASKRSTAREPATTTCTRPSRNGWTVCHASRPTPPTRYERQWRQAGSMKPRHTAPRDASPASRIWRWGPQLASTCTCRSLNLVLAVGAAAGASGAVVVAIGPPEIRLLK